MAKKTTKYDLYIPAGFLIGAGIGFIFGNLVGFTLLFGGAGFIMRIHAKK